MVEVRESLWNFKIDAYRNRNEKEKCWSEIAAATNHCIADCKSQFNAVRSRYNRTSTEYSAIGLSTLCTTVDCAPAIISMCFPSNAPIELGKFYVLFILWVILSHSSSVAGICINRYYF